MLPAILPMAKIVSKAPKGVPYTIQSLCEMAGIECRVTGPAADRQIYLRETNQLEAAREPGSLGIVSMGLPASSQKDRAILALGSLAYSVFDYAARESLRGRPESKMALPLGRPRKAQPLDGASRQRRYRERLKTTTETSPKLDMTVRSNRQSEAQRLAPIIHADVDVIEQVLFMQTLPVWERLARGLRRSKLRKAVTC